MGAVVAAHWPESISGGLPVFRPFVTVAAGINPAAKAALG
jgi:predicted anti-sigma-YlaC factor YlaD